MRWWCARPRATEKKGDSARMTQPARTRPALCPPCLLPPLPRPSPFLIYTANIRNRRNCPTITNLHFSNLYRSPALFLFCSSISFESPSCPSAPSAPSAPLRWAPSCSSSRVAAPGSWGLISSRASNASRGIPPLPTREPRAKLQRTLIYGTGIKISRKSLKTKDRHHA